MLGNVEQVWPREAYGRVGHNTPYENILRLCMELRQEGYVEAWFNEHQDGGDVNMYERFVPIFNVIMPENGGRLRMIIAASQRAVYRWSRINVINAHNWWRSQPQSMHHSHA